MADKVNRTITEPRGGNGVQSIAETANMERQQVTPLEETTGANSKVIKTEE